MSSLESAFLRISSPSKVRLAQWTFSHENRIDASITVYSQISNQPTDCVQFSQQPWKLLVRLIF